ncbi:PAS domain-containing protein [Sphingomonas lutea]|uniref:histidine kinase n=1 Tax=Sphingomonas lutea TaxID=1045317 RepID=A0A7G9SJC2_9SPHN|nr:PAS domain-containing protein [Sphingomonas lutea]QNN67947.1 PAS domain-containing protein [Sphingomonas lutea]
MAGTSQRWRIFVYVEKPEAETLAARRALLNSDARFKVLANALPHMVWSTLPDGDHDFYNARWYEFTGVPEGSTDGEGWNGMFHPDDQERAWERWRRSLATGEPYEIEYRLRRHDGEYRWTLGRAMPVRDADGNIVRWIGTCTEIHDAKEHAAQNEILSRELSHRIKNIFAVIGGLIGMSARDDPQQKAFAKRLQERVAALGRAHEFVRPHSEHSSPNRLPGTSHGVLREILSPYPALSEGRITIDGEDVAIDDRGATPFALLVHELATNASKYGALSVPDGRIEITTRVHGDQFEMRWKECGGPTIEAPPEHQGFGTKLSELSIVQQLGGAIDRDWTRDGLIIAITVPTRGLVR